MTEDIDNTPMHHFLITGQVVHKAGETFNAVFMNGIIKSPTPELGVHQLNRAQQVLQMNFNKKVGDNEANIVDVVIMSISPLGLMTAAEFDNSPKAVE